MFFKTTSEKVLKWGKNFEYAKIIKALQHSDKSIRMTAIQVISKAPSNIAVKPLQSQLADKDPEIVTASLKGLADNSSEESLSLLVTLAENPAYGLSKNAFNEICIHGSAAMIRPLIYLRQFQQFTVPANNALRTIAKNIIHELEFDLSAIVSQKDTTEYFNSCVNNLATIGKQALESLIPALSLKKVTQIIALAAISAIQDRRVIDPLFRMLDNPDPDIRSQANASVQHLKSYILNELRKDLNEGNMKKLGQTVSRLQQIGWRPENPEESVLFFVGTGDFNSCLNYKNEAIPVLKKYIQQFPENREAYVALTNFGYDVFAPYLKGALVCCNADNTLISQIQSLGEEVVNDLANMYSGSSKTVKKDIISIISIFNNPNAVEILDQAVLDLSSRKMMELAARAVKKGNLDVSERAKTLMLVLTHDWQGIKEFKIDKGPHISACFSEYAEILEFEEKTKLIDILGGIGDESSCTLLLDFATQEGEFQEASIRALGKIRKELVTNTLSDYLISGKSDNENILIALISTLGNSKKASLTPLLDKFIDHDFEEVRKETAIALEKLGVDTYKSIVSGSENDLYFLALEGRSNRAIPILFSELKSYSYDNRKKAALKLINIAELNPDLLKDNLVEIRKLITSKRVNNHSDNTIFRSNDCDHHTDHHEDSGIGMSVPF